VPLKNKEKISSFTYYKTMKNSTLKWDEEMAS